MIRYCISCGIELPEETNYCGSCGKQQTDNKSCNTSKIQGNDMCSNQGIKEFVRTDEQGVIEKLEAAYNYFMKKQNDYDELDRLTEKYQIMSKRKWQNTLFLCLIVYFFFIVIFGPLLHSLITLYIFLIVTFIPIIVMIPAKTSNRYQIENDEMRLKIREIEKKLLEYYESYPDRPIAYEYSNPRFIRVIKKYIETGRADSIKEALNCIKEDIYREQMINKQEQIISNTKRAASAAELSVAAVALAYIDIRRRF